MSTREYMCFDDINPDDLTGMNADDIIASIQGSVRRERAQIDASTPPNPVKRKITNASDGGIPTLEDCKGQKNIIVVCSDFNHESYHSISKNPMNVPAGYHCHYISFAGQTPNYWFNYENVPYPHILLQLLGSFISDLIDDRVDSDATITLIGVGIGAELMSKTAMDLRGRHNRRCSLLIQAPSLCKLDSYDLLSFGLVKPIDMMHPDQMVEPVNTEQILAMNTRMFRHFKSTSGEIERALLQILRTEL